MANILVIDDEEDILFVVKKILESVGHKVEVATSGLMGIKKLEEGIPDLILLDIMMPDLNGWETLKLIREQDDLKSVPVSMLTATSMTPEVASRKEISELVDYIEKPFTRVGLVKRVNYNIIDDLDRIEQKKTRLSAIVRDEETVTSYEVAARLERLHRSILSTLRENMDKIESSEKESIKTAIKSQEQAIELFRKRRDQIESRLKDESVLIGEEIMELIS